MAEGPCEASAERSPGVGSQGSQPTLTPARCHGSFGFCPDFPPLCGLQHEPGTGWGGIPGPFAREEIATARGFHRQKKDRHCCCVQRDLSQPSRASDYQLLCTMPAASAPLSSPSPRRTFHLECRLPSCHPPAPPPPSAARARTPLPAGGHPALRRERAAGKAKLLARRTAVTEEPVLPLPGIKPAGRRL